MHDSLGVPACFSSSGAGREKQRDEPAATVIRSGQSVFMSTYRTKLAGECRLITITWCKNLLLHGLSVSVQATSGQEHHHKCKVELKPWYFWRKQGSKQFIVDGKTVDIVWDLKAAKFNGETEPSSDYYVAIVCDEEVVLLVGDLKKDCYRKTRCRPALIEPMLVSRKEHVFGKKKFTTRVKLQEKEALHEISMEFVDGFDPELDIKVDGQLTIQVKHLQWKFRGNEAFHVSKTRVELYWDVHDWLFGSGPRHGLFIFKPAVVSSSERTPPPSTAAPEPPLLLSEQVICGESEAGGSSSSSFCLLLYAWKVE